MLIKKETISEEYGIDIRKLYTRYDGLAITTALSNFDKILGIKKGMLHIRIRSNKMINPKYLRQPNYFCAKLNEVTSDKGTEEYITFYFIKLDEVEKKETEVVL